MNEVIHTTPLSANSLDTSEILLIFSSLSSGVKPRFLLRPVLTLSPSNTYAGIPRETKYSSRANDIVVLPAPDKPADYTNHSYNVVFYLYYIIPV